MKKLKKFFKKLYALVKSGFIYVKSDWVDDLIWCPSQCYLMYEYKGVLYCTYLRWRHDDPWTMDIIKNYSPLGSNDAEDWISVPINYYRADDLPELKEEAEIITKLFLAGYFEDDMEPGGLGYIIPPEVRRKPATNNFLLNEEEI